MTTKLIPLTLIFLLLLVSPTVSYSQNTDLDKKLGQDGAKMVASEMGIYTHDVATPFIQDMGQGLITKLNPALFEYNFEIVDMQSPNAFALPAGYIYVSRGLLCLVNSEDELAGVLGHEIMHSELRHSVQQMRKRILPALLQIPGAIVGTVVNENLGQLINSPLNAGSQLFLASYSRKHEKQADKGGTLLMAAKGYDPTHFPRVLDNLSLLVETITGHEEEFTYFDSHPYTPKRIKYLNKQIEKLSPAEGESISGSQDDFLRKLDGIYAGNNPAYGVFQENRFLHPGLGLFMRYPEGWAAENRPGMVGAIDTSNNQSMVVMGLTPREEMPEALGTQFAERLLSEYQVVPDRAETVDLNGMPAYLVSLKDETSSEVVRIYSLWFRLNGQTFQLLGFAPDSQTEELRNTALSIRTLAEQERNSIHVPVLRIRKALEGESIGDFNARTGNLWNDEVTAVMNSLEAESLLEKDQTLKVAVQEKYVK